MSAKAAAIAVDCGQLPLGGGLLALLRPALNEMEPGGVLAVLSRATTVREDLPSWCRAERHEYLGLETIDGGIDRHLIMRGEFSVANHTSNESQLKPREGKLTASDVLDVAPLPLTADPLSGFAPRGARIEPGGPAYPFTLNERDHAAHPEVAKLYDQSVSRHCDAAGDIRRDEVTPPPSPLTPAVAHVTPIPA